MSDLRLVPGTTGEPTEPPPALWLPEVGDVRNPALELLGAEQLADFYARGDAEPPFSWLWEPLVPASGTVFAIAPPGTGKTWFALMAAKRAAETGRTVIFVEEEGSARGLTERLRGVGVPATADVHVIHRKGLRVDVETTLTCLIAAVEDAPSPVLVLDPMVTLFSGDENSTEDCTELIRRLGRLMSANPRLLLMVIHHSSKAATRDTGGAAVYAARGSSVLSGWFDAQLNLDKPKRDGEDGPPRERGVVEFAVSVPKMRGAEEVRGSLEVRLELGTGLVTVGQAAERKARDRAAEVLSVLEDGPASGNAVIKAVGGYRVAVRETINQLVKDGVLLRRADRKLEVVP